MDPLLNLSHHRPTNWDWWTEYEKTHKGLLEYKHKIYTSLYRLPVGASFCIQRKVDPSNYDLFIKIAAAFIIDTKCCYEFNELFNTIKHKFDAQEMEEKLRFFAEKRRENDNRRNGIYNQSQPIGTTTIPTQTPVVREYETLNSPKVNRSKNSTS